MVHASAWDDFGFSAIAHSSLHTNRLEIGRCAVYEVIFGRRRERCSAGNLYCHHEPDLRETTHSYIHSDLDSDLHLAGVHIQNRG